MEITSSEAQRVKLVCPKCEQQELYFIDLTSEQVPVSCSRCHTEFRARVAIVRAKRSNGSKKNNRRTFSVRVQRYDGREELIEFVNAGTQDFELRARDIAAFSYLGDQLRIVQNLSVRQYMVISKPQCYLATCAYGPDAPEVQLLREWRDRRLIGSSVGLFAVSLYYTASSWLTHRCGHSKLFARIIRLLLNPLIWIVDSTTNERRTVTEDSAARRATVNRVLSRRTSQTESSVHQAVFSGDTELRPRLASEVRKTGLDAH